MFDITQEAFDRTLCAVRADRSIAFHNAKLIEVVRGTDGKERVTAEIAGASISFSTPRPFTEAGSRHLIDLIGRVGVVTPAVDHIDFDGHAHFRPYPDQSLRRSPELDRTVNSPRPDEKKPHVIGWRCDAQPDGFTAPAGLIPGKGGSFIPDDTEDLTIAVPPEFRELCRQYALSPKDVLQGFIADAAGLSNMINTLPRADGYSSNGSDERDMAEAYLGRAYDMRREIAEQSLVESEMDQEREIDKGILLSMLEDFDGDFGELIDVVESHINDGGLSDPRSRLEFTKDGDDAPTGILTVPFLTASGSSNVVVVEATRPDKQEADHED